MIVQRLLRVSVTVADLEAAVAFYAGALEFTPGRAEDYEPALARLLGADRVTAVQMGRGGQVVELAAFHPPGAAYPARSRSNDLWFQHCALTVADIAAAYARLRRHVFTPISLDGPVTLPAEAGGVTAFKFRDPEGHPLELIHIPGRSGADGVDHSAIAVADVARSVEFYAALGLTVGSRSLNTGPAQDALDGLDGVVTDVVALLADRAGPHVELLGYRSPAGRSGSAAPSDAGSGRLVFAVDGLAGQAGAVRLQAGGHAALVRDPDGHALVLLG